MTVTASTRLGITRWSAGTDPFTRAQMDGSFATLDDLVAIDMQGLLSARPAAGVRGRYYWATDGGGSLSRDTGTAWVAVGAATYGAPGTSAVGHAVAEGTSASVARADHQHGREAFGAVVAQTSGQASANGTATTVARSDHAHGFPVIGAVATAVTPGAAAAAGTATSIARTDHVHSAPAWAAGVAAETGWGVAAAVGVAATFARGDHTHGSPATPVTSLAATGATTVSASTGAVSLASPPYATTAPTAITYGATGAVGTAASIARGDHTHAMPTMPTAADVGALPITGGTLTGNVAVTNPANRGRVLLMASADYGRALFYNDTNPGVGATTSGMQDGVAYDTAGVLTTFTRLTHYVEDPTDGSEDGYFRFFTMNAGVLQEVLRVGSTGGEVDTTLATRLRLKAYRETFVSHGAPAAAATVTVDVAAGTMHAYNGSAGGTTVAFANHAVGDSWMLRIQFTTVQAVTWPAGILWQGGAPPALALGHNIISFWNDSGTIFASYGGVFA